MNVFKMKDVPKGQRLQFFKDYYLMKTIVFLLIVSTLIYLVVTIASPNKINLLNVAVVDEALDQDDVIEAENMLLDRYTDGNKNNVVTINDSYYSDNVSITKIQVEIMNRAIDVIIAPKDAFSKVSGYGYMQQIDDKYASYFDESSLYYTEGFGDDNLDNPSGKGEVLPYGVIIDSNSTYGKYLGLKEDSVIGVVVNSKNKENALDFLKLMCETK